MSGPDRLYEYVEPSVEERDTVWQLAHAADSSAVYLLWCIDYAESSLIARVDEVAVACIVGRRLLSQPDELTVLALAVSSGHADSRLRELLLFNLVQRMRRRHQIRFVRIEIEGSEKDSAPVASRTVAHWLGAACEESTSADTGASGYRIGPLT
ncbi:MAG: hypothetical protein LLG14_17610 [Nocardiaceae bacterium]|nr:hypothetical protein [Nocardiaceae bacterium]